MIVEFEQWEDEVRAIVEHTNLAEALAEVARRVGLPTDQEEIEALGWSVSLDPDRRVLLGRRGQSPHHVDGPRCLVVLRKVVVLPVPSGGISEGFLAHLQRVFEDAVKQVGVPSGLQRRQLGRPALLQEERHKNLYVDPGVPQEVKDIFLNTTLRHHLKFGIPAWVAAPTVYILQTQERSLLFRRADLSDEVCPPYLMCYEKLCTSQCDLVFLKIKEMIELRPASTEKA